MTTKDIPEHMISAEDPRASGLREIAEDQRRAVESILREHTSQKAAMERGMRRERDEAIERYYMALSREQGERILRMRAESTVARLKELIREAPHGMGCHSIQPEFQNTPMWGAHDYCDCWKHVAMEVEEE